MSEKFDLLLLIFQRRNGQNGYVQVNSAILQSNLQIQEL